MTAKPNPMVPDGWPSVDQFPHKKLHDNKTDKCHNKSNDQWDEVLHRGVPFLIQQCDLLDSPDVIRNPRFHRWRHAERLMHTTEVVIDEV